MLAVADGSFPGTGNGVGGYADGNGGYNLHSSTPKAADKLGSAGGGAASLVALERRDCGWGRDISDRSG
jgi:hypothetical protein